MCGAEPVAQVQRSATDGPANGVGGSWHRGQVADLAGGQLAGVVAAAGAQLAHGLLHRVVVADAGRDLDHLRQRPVRDPFAIGQAATGEDRRALDARKVPGLCFDLQLITLRNVLEYTRLFPKGVDQVMFVSSSTVYGDFETPTVDESVRPKPYGIYANAKYMGERLVRTYNDQYGLGVTIVRPSALYGERCISRRVSQAFIENALMGKPLLLEGGGDGRLDFTYIEDLVDGMIRAMAAHPGPGTSNTFNLTFGNARTILELANVVKSVVPDAILEDRPRDQIKPVRGTLSTKRAEEVLNFKAQWPLETGYKRYCEWYVDQWDRTKRYMHAN